MTETWLPVVGYEVTYEVSSLGRVRSVPRKRTRGRILKQLIRPDGRAQVGLSQDGKARAGQVHHLVIRAFHGPRPTGMVSRHLNGDLTDNRASNLAWATQSQNLLDSVVHGTNVNANKRHCPLGHEYTPENTRLQVKGNTTSRACITCSRERSAAAYDKYRKKPRSHIIQPRKA